MTDQEIEIWAELIRETPIIERHEQARSQQPRIARKYRRPRK